MARRSKLSPEAVLRVRDWYEEWLRVPTMVEMARREGVTVNTLRAAVLRLTHKRVHQ